MSQTDDTQVAVTRGDETVTRGNGLDAVDLEHRPETVLKVLEADQLVAAKERAHFGRKKLSGGVQALLWGLRLYVVFMMVLVAVQVINAIHGGVQ